MTVHQPDLANRLGHHYTGIRKRLMGADGNASGKATEKDAAIDINAVTGSAISALETRIKHLRSALKAAEQVNRTYVDIAKQLRKAEDRAEKLELDLSDARARILAQADLLKIPLEGDFPEEGDRRRSVELIVKDVLRDWPGVTWDDIRGIRRTRSLVAPRHACVRAVFDERKDLSSVVIGRIFGGRDHTTILNSIKKTAS
jgi:chromosomal replication initiation ATPase DnaA